MFQIRLGSDIVKVTQSTGHSVDLMALEQTINFPKETPLLREVLWTSLKYAYGLFGVFFQMKSHFMNENCVLRTTCSLQECPASDLRKSDTYLMQESHKHILEWPQQ